MSPTPFHAKQEQHDGGAFDPSPLNIIHRLPPPSSTGSSTSDVVLTNKSHQQPPPPPRRPVIIYTHSPKVIHTHPRDFMALVQKLTGYTPPPEEMTQPAQHQRGFEDNESANSVVTEEHGTSVNDIGPQVNSCFVDNNGVSVGIAPPPYRTTTTAGYDPYFNPTSVFQTNSTDFLCTPPFYNPDSMFMNRNPLSSSSSSLRVLKEYPDI